MQVTTGTALWYKTDCRSSNDPLVPLRWVLVRDPEGKIAIIALLCTTLDLDAKKIINYSICRWTIKAAADGFFGRKQKASRCRIPKTMATAAQSDLAIARTTPVLMGMYSIVTLWAN